MRHYQYLHLFQPWLCLSPYLAPTGHVFLYVTCRMIDASANAIFIMSVLWTIGGLHTQRTTALRMRPCKQDEDRISTMVQQCPLADGSTIKVLGTFEHMLTTVSPDSIKNYSVCERPASTSDPVQNLQLATILPPTTQVSRDGTDSAQGETTVQNSVWRYGNIERWLSGLLSQPAMLNCCYTFSNQTCQ